MTGDDATTRDGAQRIRAAFEAARAEGRTALITYLMGGDPGPGRSAPMLRALVDGGADLIEVGIPFSDPVADGPTIQAAAVRALEAGTHVQDVLDEVRSLRDDGVDVPIVVMTYANVAFASGYDTFATRLADAGVDGVILPDVPVDEAAPVRAAFSRHGVALVLLAAPTSRGERLDRIARASEGFLYLVGTLGTTGARDELAPETVALVERVLPVTREVGVPVALGFGVSKPDHVQALATAGADAVVVGSALVDLVAKGAGPDTVREFVARLRAGTPRLHDRATAAAQDP